MSAEARRGVSFIEVLLSLVLLAIAGTALVTLLGQTAHTIQGVRESEAQTTAAGLELSALTELDRGALIARVGRSRAHGWSMTIEHTSSDLFDVSVASSDTGLVLVHTTIYRPDSVRHVTP
jgi:Tfp pilus assembly protein PilV